MTGGPITVSTPQRPTFGEAIAGFYRMPITDKAMLPLAWALLGGCAVILRLTSFRRLAPLLGQTVGAVGCVPLTSLAQENRARTVRRAIQRAARISPWRNDCLPQALTGVILCRTLSVPVTTHLGVRLDGAKPMEAHAWTCSGKIAVTGGDGFLQWTPVQCFLAHQRHLT